MLTHYNALSNKSQQFGNSFVADFIARQNRRKQYSLMLGALVMHFEKCKKSVACGARINYNKTI